LKPQVKIIELKCKPLFDVEKIVATPAAMKAMGPEYAMNCLANHMTGDWGLTCAEDAEANDRAVKTGARILSVWPLPDAGGEFWIITEADRSVTTFLLPEDY
jgi:hypothetical protein